MLPTRKCDRLTDGQSDRQSDEDHFHSTGVKYLQSRREVIMMNLYVISSIIHPYWLYIKKIFIMIRIELVQNSSEHLDFSTEIGTVFIVPLY